MYTLGRQAVPGSSLVSLADAQAECDRALALNPDFAAANQTRTLINQLLGQSDGVRSDLERFSLLARSSDPIGPIVLRIGMRTAPGERFRPISEGDEVGLWRVIADDARNDRAMAVLADSLKLSDRDGEAFDLYDRAVDDNPNHLSARFQRAIELARANSPDAYEEFAALVDHPRFEEIYRIRPDAFRAYTYVVRDLLLHGRIADAEVMARRGWAAIHQSGALREETVKARNNSKTAIYPRGEMHYCSARIDVAAARADPARLTAAVAHLKEAFAASPTFRTERFPTDRFFDFHRREILERVDEFAVH